MRAVISAAWEALAPALARPWGFVSLTKPDVTFLVLLTTMAGFYLGSRGPVDYELLAHTLFGTILVAMGTAALNHYIERDADARMRRTASRPLPQGTLRPVEALLFGAGLVLSGVVYLAFLANALASLLALTTCVLYLGVYTPLKKRTTLATAIGAVPGALPPLIGWVAAHGSLSLGGWLLFGILFLWQFPHFMAIAWMYREDYSRAGILMLPVVDPAGTATFRQIIVTAALLVPMSLLPAVTGMAGAGYFFGAVVLGMALLQVCLWAARTRTNVRAKWLMHATVAHIPLLLGLLILDRLAR
jgi:protoheme IX farnesyltransferase